LHSRAIEPQGIQRLYDDSVARLHAMRRRVPAHRVEEPLRIEMVRRHAVSSWKSQASRLALSHLKYLRKNCELMYANIAIW
jgi:hypothetical protein